MAELNRDVCNGGGHRKRPPAAPRKPVSCLAEIYELGGHLLPLDMCGLLILMLSRAVIVVEKRKPSHSSFHSSAAPPPTRAELDEAPDDTRSANL